MTGEVNRRKESGGGVIMEISAVNRTDAALPVAAASIPSEIANQNREVVQAVKAVNQSGMFGQGEELAFQMDSATKRLVVQIIDSTTKKVISQVPPEYVLRMAESLKST
jgi:flagellar protein FlaG